LGTQGIIVSLGSPVKGPVKRLKMDVDRLTVAPKGSLWDIEIKTKGMTPEQASAALEKLINGMSGEFGIKTIYAHATGDTIFLEIMGSPFVWASLLVWLPMILTLVGIAVMFTSVWQVISGVPSWVWGLLVIGAAMVFLAPAIGRAVTAVMPPPPPQKG
jgi:hypothetical protein